MTSLARRHRERTAAELLAGTALQPSTTAPAIDDANPAAADYRNLLVSLEADQREISDIHSHAARNPVKQAKAATYGPWVQGALAAGASEVGAATQDAIVAEMLVWAVDYANYDYALEIAGHMIRHGVALPERFKASVAAFLAEKIADAALAPTATDNPVPLAVLQSVFRLTADADMHDEKRAKLMKALSRAYAADAEAFDAAADNAAAGGKAALTQAALVHAKRALELFKNIGVKKDIEQLERKLEALGGAPAPDPEQKPEVSDDAQGADAAASG